MVGYAGRGTNTPTGFTNKAETSKLETVARRDVVPETAPNKNAPKDFTIVDDYGRVVAVQHFDSQEKANGFYEAIRLDQEKQEMPGGNVVPVAARF